MTIGFDGSRAFVEHKTGTENYSYQLLRHLTQIDRHNTYIVYLRPNNVIPGLIRDPNETLNQVQGDKKEDWPANFQFKIINFPRFWTQIGLSLRTFIDPIDVLFVTAHTLPLIHRPGLKTVMVAHDLGAEYLPSMHQLKQRMYLNFITHYQFKTATRVIAVSEATKKDLIAKAGVDPAKIDVIYEGIDTTDFSPISRPKTTSVLNKYGLKQQSFFFFLGTIQPRKNLANLIKAFAKFLARHPEFISGSQPKKSKTKIPNPFGLVQDGQVQDDNDYKLVIAGGKGWLSDEIYQLPRQLGIADRVIFPGRVSDDEARALFANAIAFTYPSLFEGFGLPILEAFALDCPVITSNVSSMPEVAGDAAVLVDPKNVDEITHAMEQVSSANIRQSLIQKGRKQLTKFSWETTARATLRVLKETNGA